jgi:TonB family protein
MVKIDVTELDALPANAVMPEVSAPEAGFDRSFMPFNPGKDSVKPPKLAFSVDPKYPRKMRRKHKAGMVIVTLVVDKSGGVRELEPIYASDKNFISASLKSVSQFRFGAAQLGSAPVATEIDVQLNFRIR